MKMKNVKLGMKVQVKDIAPSAWVTSLGQVGIVYSIDLEGNSLRVGFPDGETDYIDVSEVKRVKEDIDNEVFA